MPFVDQRDLHDGAVISSKRGLNVRNETGSSIAAGKLVYVSSWSESQKKWLVTLADADVAGRRATYVMRAALANNSNGRAYKQNRLKNVATNGTTVGDAIYLDVAAGGWTATDPQIADPLASSQIIGRVAVVSATVGEIEFDLDAMIEATQDGSGDIGDILPSNLSLKVRKVSGGNLAAGDIVYVSSWYAAGRWAIDKADSDAAVGLRAGRWIMRAALNSGVSGTAYKTHTLTGLNTNAGNVGDPVYLDATAGGWTLTRPTAADARSQVVGRISVKSIAAGEIEFDLTQQTQAEKIGTTDLQDVSVTTGKLAVGVISADAPGRALFAAGVLDQATALSAFAANSIDNAVLLDAVADGAFVADDPTRTLFGANFIGATATGRALMATNYFDAAGRMAKFANVFAMSYDFELPAGGTLEPPWAVDLEDGDTVGAFVANAAGGIYTLTGGAGVGATSGQIAWGVGGTSNVMINPTKAPIVEMRVAIDYAAAGGFAADGRAVFGLCSAHNNAEDGLDAVVSNVWFRGEGANKNILVEGDDGVHDVDDIDTTVDFVDNTFVVLTIDMTSLAVTRFFIDGTLQAATVDLSSLVATDLLMPIVCWQRDGGTASQDVVKIDYIRVYANR